MSIEKEPLINSKLLEITGAKLETSEIESRGNEKIQYCGMTRSYSRWSPDEEGVTVAWRDLSVYAYNKNANNKRDAYKRIVNNVTGAVKYGTLVALMGPSGAGKSTFMNALAHRTSAGMIVDGDILINGRPIGDYMKNLSGFVYQHDIFTGSLTVSEHLCLMAHLKFSRNATADERNQRISYLLKHLGLTHRMHTRIGVNGDEKVLSGGEKKRLALATELLTNPSLLFCDEPTTGLDSYSAQKIIQMLNTLASQGKTIICTIHQPSSQIFAMFDQLILLTEGRIAFMGHSEQALDFFEKQGYECPKNYNPSDFFIKIIATTPGSEEASKTSIRKICDQYAVSEAAKEVEFVVQYEFHMGISSDQSSFTRKLKKNGPFWWSKLYWITYRCILQVLRDPSVQRLRMIQKVVIALMVGFCYVGSTTLTQAGIQAVQGALFMLVAENTFTPMYTVLELFPRELPLFIREYKSGLYSASIYYIANVIAMLPGLILEPVLFISIFLPLTGLRPSFYAILMTAIITILTMNVSAACGTFFSAAFESVPMAMAFLVPFDYVLMITSGVFIQLSTIPPYLQWAKYLSWIMYSNEALSIIQWNGITNITCEIPASATEDEIIPCIQTGDEVLEKYSFSADHLVPNMIFLVAFYCFYHILGFLFLLRRAKKN
ncbi:protein scarlet [Chrysoperla carnea]|uniref:protein scarlet n=1 Tax=Chrysoperla carnea TaxID=189513 RepID=UPI001D07DA15|nr:protein scarlet [Chrysoperla carnea]XP_044734553.1 protein scarlet [Chrysoperla carnea]